VLKGATVHDCPTTCCMRKMDLKTAILVDKALFHNESTKGFFKESLQITSNDFLFNKSI
jgi:hypothetical protein